MKKKFWLFSSIIVLSILLAVFVCQGVSAGGEMSEIDARITSLEKENSQLEKQIAKQTACIKLYDQAFKQTEIVALKR